ncbi:hypothetical protein [Archangium lipolyticum]|uniref:hypothetical protein n=1 Tax=Archangium lipolyticum TaxID=2970465 RepID=UPI002149C920|nr:hypothetical protein [Archangium lipolyticum]
MPEKPSTRAGYPPELAELARSTCLYVATILGDLTEELTVVGGLVPSLLISPEDADDSVEAHVGTLDLDLGLSIAVFDEARYQKIAERLREAGFKQAPNDKGRPSRQTWGIETHLGRMTLDFLIPPTLPTDQPGKLRNLEPDFAAIITPGLHLAFTDRQRVPLNGITIRGERTQRDVWVCGAGAFIVLKALAFKFRGTNKDAYDLFYVLKYFGRGVEDVVERIRPFLQDEHCRQALAVLRQDFLAHDALGPMRVAHFLESGPDDTIQADVVGFVRLLLSSLEK